MAEKRGQYVYNDDGTVSQLVSISGADSNGSGLGVTTTDVLPMDMQARLINTAVTHTSVVIAPSTLSAQSTWQQVPEGMTEFIQNLVQDTGASAVTIRTYWSDDGSTISGKTEPTVVSNTFPQRTSMQWFPVGGSFYKADIWNGDAAPKTCSANIKFRP